jgi:hypothetical protein
MKKQSRPKNVIPFNITEHILPAGLPSAEWLQDLKHTLKQQADAATRQTEATLALVRLTTEAAQRIAAHAHNAALAAVIFTEEERHAGLVDYGRATKLITGLKKGKQAEQACTELFRWSAFPRRKDVEGYGGDWWEISGTDEEDDIADKMTTRMVLHWMERYQDFVREVPNKGKERAKKYFDAITCQSAPKPAQKRGRKRQVAARGKRYKSKTAK